MHKRQPRECFLALTRLEAELGSQLRDQGFDAAAIVMLGGPGAGTNAGFWSRFVMVEGLGIWAMEFMHALTGFADLYPFDGDMGAFDQTAGSRGTHPSAFTKAAIGWLDSAAVRLQTGRTALHALYTLGLVQPRRPAGWRRCVSAPRCHTSWSRRGSGSTSSTRPSRAKA